MKTRKVDNLVNDQRIAFDCLRANWVKLSPEKCVFRVPHSMLLGYIVSQRGIEPNPEKIATLDRMGPIRDLKGVQKLLGCLATLSRLISRLDEKGFPLYRLLKKDERFSSLLGINPLPTPIYGCNMAVLVASGISCIEVRLSTNGCNWNGAIA
jgi:hypothetical protein